MADQELRSRITVGGADLAAKQLEKVAAATEELGEATKEANRLASEVDEERGRSALASGRTAAIITGVSAAIVKTALALRTVSKAFQALPAVGSIVASATLIIRTLRQEVAERLRLVKVIRDQGAALDLLKSKQRDQLASIERFSDQRRFGGFDAQTASRVQGQAQQAQKAFPFLQPSDINAVFGTFGGGGLTQEDLTDLTILLQAGQLDFDPQRFRSQRSVDRFGERNLRRGRARGVISRIAERETIEGERGGTGKKAFRPGLTKFQQDVQSEASSPEGSTGQLRTFLEGLQISGGISPETDLDLVTRLIKFFGSSEQLRAANLTPLIGPPTDEIQTTGVNRLRIPPSVDIKSTQPGGFISDIFERLGLAPSENIDFGSFKEAVEILKRIEQFGTIQPANITINNNQGQRIVSPSAATQQRAITNGGNALRDRVLVGF